MARYAIHALTYLEQTAFSKLFHSDIAASTFGPYLLKTIFSTQNNLNSIASVFVRQSSTKQNVSFPEQENTSLLSEYDRF